MLQLVKENTSDDIQFHHLKLENIYLKCPRKRCNYRWKTQVMMVLDNPCCPACGGRV